MGSVRKRYSQPTAKTVDYLQKDKLKSLTDKKKERIDYNGVNCY